MCSVNDLSEDEGRELPLKSVKKIAASQVGERGWLRGWVGGGGEGGSAHGEASRVSWVSW